MLKWLLRRFLHLFVHDWRVSYGGNLRACFFCLRREVRYDDRGNKWIKHKYPLEGPKELDPTLIIRDGQSTTLGREYFLNKLFAQAFREYNSEIDNLHREGSQRASGPTQP